MKWVSVAAKVAASTAAIVTWFSAAILSLSYDRHGTRKPVPELGLVHPLNNHGHIVFVTSEQAQRISLLMILGVLLFFLTAAIYLVEIWTTKRWRANPERNSAL